MKFSIRQDKSLIEQLKKRKWFTIVDAILIGILLLVVVSCCIFFLPRQTGEYVVIYQSGNEIGRYSLSTNQSIDILDGKMTMLIDDFTASVKYSDCKNQICVNTKKISKSGERIVCAPNKISIVIKGKNEVLVTGGAI